MCHNSIANPFLVDFCHSFGCSTSKHCTNPAGEAESISNQRSSICQVCSFPAAFAVRHEHVTSASPIRHADAWVWLRSWWPKAAGTVSIISVSTRWARMATETMPWETRGAEIFSLAPDCPISSKLPELQMQMLEGVGKSWTWVIWSRSGGSGDCGNVRLHLKCAHVFSCGVISSNFSRETGILSFMWNWWATNSNKQMKTHCVGQHWWAHALSPQATCMQTTGYS